MQVNTAINNGVRRASRRGWEVSGCCVFPPGSEDPVSGSGTRKSSPREKQQQQKPWELSGCSGDHFLPRKKAGDHLQGARKLTGDLDRSEKQGGPRPLIFILWVQDHNHLAADSSSFVLSLPFPCLLLLLRIRLEKQNKTRISRKPPLQRYCSQQACLLAGSPALLYVILNS